MFDCTICAVLFSNQEVTKTMKVGIPFMKCSINPSSQKSNTCDLQKAWREMNDERIGKDETINHSMTYKNIWMHGQSEDDVIQKVQNKIQEINTIRKQAGKRAMRKDCVSVVEFIEKPNIDFMKEQSYEDKIQFLKDSHLVMQQLIYEWNPHWQIIESVQHHDEFGGLSAHNHTLVMLTTQDSDGIPNMRAKAEFSRDFFDFINKNYSYRMQELGHEVENVKTWDMLSSSEKQQRKQNPIEHGLDSYTYKKKKQKELDETIQTMEDKKEELHEELNQVMEQVVQTSNMATYQEVVEENQTLKTDVQTMNHIITELKGEIKSLKQKLETWKERFNDISQKAGSRLMELFGYEVSQTVERKMPDVRILHEFQKFQKRNNRDPRRYCIKPEKEEDAFCIVYQRSFSHYEYIEGHFDTKEMAQKKLDSIIDGLYVKSVKERGDSR